MDELAVVDLTDPAFWSDPYPVLAEARSRHPLARGVDGGLIAMSFDAPVLGSGRDAAESLDLFGVPVDARETVTTMSPAANRDPAAFDDPDRFDIRRPGGKLMSFGQGIHYCLGAALARLEGQVAFPMLLERYPRLELAEEPAWVPYASIRRFEQLIVTTA